jgi:hypothetical protein
VDEHQLPDLGEVRGVRRGFRQRIAMQHHLGAPCRGARDLGGGRVARHHDGGSNPQQVRVPRHRLGVIAGRHRDHPACPLALAQQRQAVGRAALLERADDLQIVELEHGVDPGGAADRVRRHRGCV